MATMTAFLEPISYSYYTNTFPLIHADDDNIRATCTHTELYWNDQIRRLISYPQKSI